MEKDQIPADFRNAVITPILDELSKALDKAGIYYRVFSRSKSPESIKRKLKQKGDKYREEGKKLQDIIGNRFVFYFLDDIEIFASYLRKRNNFLEESNSTKELEEAKEESIGSLSDKIFMPSRLNLIFRMEADIATELGYILQNIDGIDTNLIDTTYEVQLRTVLSEGWHEVEHDLRYKCRDEVWWDYCQIESRMLNGIYASLETSERALSHLFFEISYKNYKKKDWEAMLRNHLRIKLSDNLSTKIKKILDSSNDVAKLILKQEKEKVISLLFYAPSSFPLNINNIVYLINEMQEREKSEELSKLAGENPILSKTIKGIINTKATS